MSWPGWPASWRRARPPERPPPGGLIVGRGDLRRRGVPAKAGLLDRAAAAGIAVPAAFVVPDGHDPDPGVAEWAQRVGARTVAVRSAFGAEDRTGASLAGWFTSVLDVDPSCAAEAVATVRASAARRPGSFRQDVLVMAMVDAEHAGVAFSEPGTYDDVVNVTTGVADRLVAGEVTGQRHLVPRLEPAPAGWPRGLQDLLRAVRRALGDHPWDVEWADDGTTCWLLQIRPITAPTIRNEILTAANHAEILPALPSQFMTSVIAEAGPDLFDWYRQRVPGLPTDRHFLHVKAGRPMINLSLLEDMLRHLGLPTALVARSIGGGSGKEWPARPAQMVRHGPSLARLATAQVAAVVRARRNRRRVAAIGTPPADGFGSLVDDLHRSYVALVTGMFPLSSAIGPPLAALRAFGTLYEHAARHRTITTELADRISELGDVRRTSTQQAWQAELDRFLTEFGHRGVYESDIARPRYADDPSPLLTDGGTGGAPGDGGPRRPPRTWRGWLTWPIWALVAQPLSAREQLRHEAMRSFAAIRGAAVRLAATAVDRGQLRTVDDLWLLTADEARRLDDGWAPGGRFWAERERDRRRLAAIDVPFVVGRFDDPTREAGDDGHDQQRTRLSGLPLTVGSVTGVAVVLDEPDDRPRPDGGQPVVLVARSIDAGWITTLEWADAVVIEIGGDLSHGSILIRELGLPAVTNVAAATRRIRTGDRVLVDAGGGSIDIVTPVG